MQVLLLISFSCRREIFSGTSYLVLSVLIVDFLSSAKKFVRKWLANKREEASVLWAKRNEIVHGKDNSTNLNELRASVRAVVLERKKKGMAVLPDKKYKFMTVEQMKQVCAAMLTAMVKWTTKNCKHCKQPTTKRLTM